ncbi:uncharacterized protein proca1 [Syngnathoides biaculeatus]|uniref:uncharacterized protein proca1 n=1 Tax=Syngnathoides biaculeatus TaxID=300417 RepID=UPI002ADE55CA|nr:uncharacterized protein proca1 [Syngnathoides biaculeatus]
MYFATAAEFLVAFLGKFEATDRCCRTHDHCPHVIHAFSSKYGYTNFKWHSICHCDCDEALRGCLRQVNDTSSMVVGQVFFNVIGAPCFDFVFEERCAERHWYGLCKEFEKVPVAVVREAIPYDYGGNVLTVPPAKMKDDNKQESATQATLYGPEEHSLGNVVTAAKDFIKVLATVSSTSAAESDKESQSSSMKKNKDSAEKKKKKKQGKGRKRKQKLLQQGATVSPSGGKTEVEDVPVTNFIADHQTDTQRQSEGHSEPSNDILKAAPLMDTVKSPLVPGENACPAWSPPGKGRNKEKVPSTSPEDVFQLAVNSTDNFSATVKPQPEQEHPFEEIPQPAVNVTDILGVTTPPKAGKKRPPAVSLLKNSRPRKGRRKEKLLAMSLEEIPQPVVDSTNNVNTIAMLEPEQERPGEMTPQPGVDSSIPSVHSILAIPTSQHRNHASTPISLRLSGEKMSQPVVDYINTLSVTSPMPVKETSPTPGAISKTIPPRKGRQKEKVLATSPQEILPLVADPTWNQSTTSIPTILTLQQYPNKPIPQPALDFIDKLSVTPPLTPEETSPPGESRSKNRRPRKGKRKYREPVTSPKEISQPAVNATNTLTSQLKRGEIVRPSVDSTAVSIIVPASQPKRKHPDEEIPQPAIYSTATSIPAIVNSQHVIDSTDNSSSTSIPALKLKHQDPIDGQSVPGLPGAPDVKRNRLQDKGEHKHRKKKRKVRLDSGATGTTQGLTADLVQCPDFVTDGILNVSHLTGQGSREGCRRNKRMKATSENVLAKSLTRTTPADPDISDTWRPKAKKPGRNATSTDVRTGLSISEFPGLTLTRLPVKEGVQHSRTSWALAPKMSAMQRSMERAREQFAWKKRRKAALFSRPH